MSYLWPDTKKSIGRNDAEYFVAYTMRDFC